MYQRILVPQVFSLLDLPTDTVELNEVGRQFADKSGGYGHSAGGYGGGYGGERKGKLVP